MSLDWNNSSRVTIRFNEDVNLGRNEKRKRRNKNKIP
jgi:hypothetical protein